MAILLGSFFAKLISIGGLIGVFFGYQRTKYAALLGFVAGSTIELIMHANLIFASSIGYFTAPVAVAAAVGIGWLIGSRKKGRRQEV